MKTAAKIISVVFHPLLLATYLILVLGFFFPVLLLFSRAHLWVMTLIVFGFTFVLPAINLLLFRAMGYMHSVQLATRSERVLPFVFISALYLFIVFVFYYKLTFSINFNKIMIIVAALVVTATVLTLVVKVSIHSLAIWGMIGILLPLIRFSHALLLPTAIIIALSGLVIASRLLLNIHTPRETLIGSLAGLLVGYVGMIILF